MSTTTTTADVGQDIPMLSFIWGHFTANFAAAKVDLEGRTALVTGGNAGLGYATVLHFARSNASRIIIASRDPTRCSSAAEQVYRDVPSYRGKVDVMQLDLSSFASIKQFARDLREDKERLDFVVANAGVYKVKYEKSKDGYEQTLQVNGIGTGLMSVLVMPKLEETAGLEVPAKSRGIKPSLCVVASEVHYWAKFPQANAPGSLIDNLNDPKQFVGGAERYNMSKVLSVFMARELAKLPAVKSGKVNVNSANPGLCASGFRDEMGPIIAAIINFLSWSTEKGSRNFLYATVQDTTPGSFINRCEESAPSTFVCSAKGRETQAKYWAESVAIWRKECPEIQEVLGSTVA